MTIADAKEFEPNEAELAFNGCSAVVQSDEDFLDLWELHIDELEKAKTVLKTKLEDK